MGGTKQHGGPGHGRDPVLVDDGNTVLGYNLKGSAVKVEDQGGTAT